MVWYDRPSGKQKGESENDPFVYIYIYHIRTHNIPVWQTRQLKYLQLPSSLLPSTWKQQSFNAFNFQLYTSSYYIFIYCTTSCTTYIGCTALVPAPAELFAERALYCEIFDRRFVVYSTHNADKYVFLVTTHNI